MTSLRHYWIVTVVAALSFACIQPTLARKVATNLSAPSNTIKKKSARNKVLRSDKTGMERIAGKLNFIAYDKKTNASKETFFIDNGSDLSLSGLEIEISYFNKSGKQIHKRKVEISQLIPAKESRKVDIASWDTQKSFHYVNSTPSSKGSTPYTVRFRVLSYTKSE